MANVREPIWEGDIYWGSTKGNDRLPIHETVRIPHFLTIGEAKDKGFESHVNEKTFKNLRVYRWPSRGERIFISCDVGGGDPNTRDGDDSIICVGVLNELSQDEVIMTWKGHLNPLAFAEVASALAWGVRKMVGEDVVAPELIPEWTGPGIPMCTYIDTKNLYPNLYRYQAPGVHGLPSGKHIGWESNAKTKQFAVQACLRMVDQDLIDIPDEEIVRQMASYRQLDNMGDASSYGGSAGKHDDFVSALQILCAVMRIRSAIIPGDAAVSQVDMLGPAPELPAFDPFAHQESGIPGFLNSDLDDEGMEETLWYSSSW